MDKAKEHFIASVPRLTELPASATYLGDCCLLVGKDGKETLHAWDGQRWVDNSVEYKVQV